jgi:predicted porin
MMSIEGLTEAMPYYLDRGGPIYYKHKTAEVGTAFRGQPTTHPEKNLPCIYLKSAMYQNCRIADKAWGVGDVGSGNNFIGRAYTSSTKLNNSRSDRLINYTSPSMSGFSVQVAYGTRQEKDTTSFNVTDEITESGLGLAYSAGKLNVMLGISKEDAKLNGTTINKPEQMVLGANYDFGVAKAFVTYATADDQNNLGAKINDKKVTEIGAAIPFGKTTLQLSAFDGENKSTTTAKSDLSGYQVGVLHAFSKRTTAYAVYGVDEVKTSGASDKVERDTFGFGVRHSF